MFQKIKRYWYLFRAASDMLDALEAIETDLGTFGLLDYYDDATETGLGGAVHMVHWAARKARGEVRFPNGLLLHAKNS